MLPHADLGRAWRSLLAEPQVVHLDAAGCACPSRLVLAAQIAHLRREAAVGGYVAEVEVGPVVEGLRAGLAELVGARAGEVALVDSATRGFAVLLAAWPLPSGARVGVLASEHGSNRMALEAASRGRGLELVPLPASPAGRLRLDGLEECLEEGLALVTFPHVASHRGVVQPAAEAAERCRGHGVPLVVDVAQSAGQLQLSSIGAAAYVGTSRKWLRGPRGVGFVVVGDEWAARLDPPVAGLATHEWGEGGPVPRPGAARLEAAECPVAARVGLAVALGELAAAGVARVAERVAELGRLARHRLDGVAGWRVQEPLDEPCGTVTLAHPHVAPEQAQLALLGRGLLTSSIPVGRNPYDLTAPVLRASFHAYAESDDVERLAQELEAVARPTL